MNIISKISDSNLDEKKVLVLLENEAQVSDFLSRFKLSKNIKIIALSPFAMYELEKRNVSYVLPEYFYDESDFYSVGVENYKKVEKFCELLDSHIQGFCPTVRKIGIKPAFFSFYYLKMLYDTITLRIFQLSKIVEKEEPDLLLVYETEEYPFGISESAPQLIFDNRESIFFKLVDLCSCGVRVEKLSLLPQFQQLEKKPKPSVIHLVKKKAKFLLQSRPEIFTLVSSIHRHGLSKAFSSITKMQGNKPILLFGDGYNWNSCESAFNSAGIGPVIRISDNLEYWVSKKPQEDFDPVSLMGYIKNDKSFMDFFVYRDVDFFPIVEKRIEFLLRNLVPACLNAYTQTYDLVRSKKVSIFLSSPLATCTANAAAKAAQDLKVPVITWQHGGSYGYVENLIIPYLDIANANFSFVFGKGVAEKYAPDAKKYGTELVRIGSTSLDLIRSRKSTSSLKKLRETLTGKKIILYVTTFNYLNLLYASFPPVFSDNYFWNTQRAILDVLGKHGDYAVIVKTYKHPVVREPPLAAYALDNGFTNCTFIRNEFSFIDLLSIADAIIIDFPSTPLLEALMTSKPVFTSTEHLHIDAYSDELLRKRVFSYKTSKDLAKALDSFLNDNGKLQNVDFNNREFIKLYGTFLEDEKTADRAVEFLKKLLDQSY